MKIVFFGTPDYVLPILKAIHKKFVTGPGISPITAVVTQPPRPVGRKQILTYSPVDKWAHEHDIPIHYSANELSIDDVKADLGILASYGEMIKKEVIRLFSHGILVIHPSLLPKYRGASPVPAAIASGDPETGVSIFKMDEKMDHGPVISQFREDISPDDTTEGLRNRLFEKSAEVLAELIGPYIRGKVKLKPQDNSQATYTKILKRADGFIDLTKDDPVVSERKFRAYDPWPGIWTYVYTTQDSKLNTQKRMKINRAHLEKKYNKESSVLSFKLVLDEVQLEGKGPVTWKQFKEAYPNFIFVGKEG
jgi:methionyl-tRNA formyltransferase